MIEIASMTQRDLKAVVEIEQRSHLEPWSEQAFQSELARDCARVYVARSRDSDSPAGIGGGPKACGPLEKRVVGYICFWILLDEIHILNVTVEAGHRGKGIGRALLSRALSLGWDSGARLALLEVRESNTAALALYRRMGFVAVGRRPGYYGVVREPAVVMELKMNEAWRRTLPDAHACACPPVEKTRL